MPKPFCLARSRMNMICDIIRPSNAPASTSTTGRWEWTQDPESGSIIQVWIEDDLLTPGIVEGNTIKNVPCLARGIIDGGIRVAGTTERFAQEYENVDWVKLVVPNDVVITKRDKVRNIRQLRTKEVIWKEEEMQNTPNTIFNVMGAIPVLDPFSSVIEYNVLLQRSEVQ